MPYGRGGAGNYEAAAAAAVQSSNPQTGHDIEAQRSTHDRTDLSLDDKAPEQYAHSGRGGAGNYYSPQDLVKTGTFEDEKPPKTTQLSPQTTIPNYRGRGGAGNYEAVTADVSQQQKQGHVNEQQSQDAIRDNVARDVEMGLAKPVKARLAAGEDE